ncbi:MAG TPA: gliding motility-associated ABC transporter substrate-binding protein GldG [Bacteroidales bacterium]|nr:gliding motility-associated ABC transporter substrate-binding protein GldG [Bacteroidales bacterium]HOE05302.1 gliding motility-associated ABC transporter substrate-binding protein GldG [Bacteroidales bacterium]
MNKASENILMRDVNQGIFGGVCQGLANHFNINVILLRVLFLLISPGLLVYLFLWIKLPKNDQGFNRRSLKKQSLVQLLLVLLIIVVVNFISSQLFFRLDLTAEKRYSLSETTRNIIRNLDDRVYIKIYLDGDDLPLGFKRLKRSVREMLDDFRVFSKNIEYEFIDPFGDADDETKREVYVELIKKGLIPQYLQEMGNSEYKEQVVFPGAIISFKGEEVPVNFFVDNITVGDQQEFNKTVSELERNFINAIWLLTRESKQKIAFIEGHGELDEWETHDIMMELSRYYQIDRLRMNGVLNSLDGYSAIVIAKPDSIFREREKFIIDQYIMRGGKVLWLVEWMAASMDSLANQVSFMALINDINLDDQLFRYGVRINPDLIQDLKCLNIPIVVNSAGGQPQFMPVPWYYFPVIVPDTLSEHPVTRNLSRIRTEFVSSMDTVGDDPAIKKTILLRTSRLSKSMMAPVEVSLKTIKDNVEPASFNRPSLPVAVLLEGEFESNFNNRLAPEIAQSEDINFIARSKPTRMIIISDGDMIRNEVKTLGDKKQAFYLGEDKYYQEQYCPGNRDFLVNCVNYLCEDEDMISLRMKDIKLRELDRGKVMQSGVFWVWFNTLLPIAIIILTGICIIIIRKMRFGRK